MYHNAIYKLFTKCTVCIITLIYKLYSNSNITACHVIIFGKGDSAEKKSMYLVTA